MIPRVKYVLLTLVLFSALVSLTGSFMSGAVVQQPFLVTLQSSGIPLEPSGPITSIFSSEDGQTLYLVSGSSGEVEAYNSKENGTFRSLGTASELTTRTLRGNLVRVGNERVTVLDPAGKPSSEFATHRAISHALFSDGSIVIASPTNRHALHVFNLNGQLVRSFGLVRGRNKSSGAQNRFLHRGRVLVDAADNVYYVFSYLPLIQKFSADGKLLSEIEVKGEAVEVQQELARRFLSTEDPQQVGAVDIITGAAIDKKTGHLWIAMNGSSDTGVVYEYDARGEKLREYSLQINSSLAPPINITGVRDIAVTSSKIFVLTLQNQVFGFDRNTFSLPGRRDSGPKTQPALSAFTPVAWASTANSPASLLQGCSTEQPWAECSFTCPGPSCSGSPPVPSPTSSNSSIQNCKAALVATLTPGYIVISAPCTPFPVSTPMHLRGGCKGDVTICRNGTNTSHTVTLDCPAPSCETSGGGGGGGGEGCIGSDCCGNELLECCSQDEWGCCNCSPILIDIEGDGFALTGAAEGVNFDLNSDGYASGVAWTTAGTDDAWLALDRNGNGKIDNSTELFGNLTPQPFSSKPNGFLALAEFDKSVYGGNGDGVINWQDSVFSSLRLWQDANHNGISEPGELHTLPALGVATLHLNYHESKWADEHGNRFRYRANVKDTKGAKVGSKAWDVFLDHAR